MTNKKKWEEEIKKGKKFVKQFSWDKIASQWMGVLDEKSKSKRK